MDDGALIVLSHRILVDRLRICIPSNVNADTSNRDDCSDCHLNRNADINLSTFLNTNRDCMADRVP